MLITITRNCMTLRNYMMCTSALELLIFGDNKLSNIMHHFQALLTRHIFDEQACLDEWLELKQRSWRNRVFRTFGLMYSQLMGMNFPNLLMVIELCLIIPVQTACVERDSYLNRIRTDQRASLDVPTVSGLMQIAINGSKPWRIWCNKSSCKLVIIRWKKEKTWVFGLE